MSEEEFREQMLKAVREGVQIFSEINLGIAALLSEKITVEVDRQDDSLGRCRGFRTSLAASSCPLSTRAFASAAVDLGHQCVNLFDHRRKLLATYMDSVAVNRANKAER